MKRIFISIVSIATLLMSSAIPAGAQELPPQHVYPSSIIITEIQTGASAGGDEFVELYNSSDSPVDITGWQIRYINATSSASDTAHLATIASDDGSPVIMHPEEHFVLHAASVVLPSEIKGQIYTPKLSSADKAVGLYAPDLQSCMYKVQDALAWGSSLAGEAAAVPQVTGSGDRLLGRYVDAAGYYIDTNHNSYDVWLKVAAKNASAPAVAQGASPGLANSLPVQTTDEYPPVGEQSGMPQATISDCELPPGNEPDSDLDPSTEEPPEAETPQVPTQTQPDNSVVASVNKGLRSPQLTELLPNPGKSLTDASDEFVELYNSNDRQFDLSGYKFEAGAGATKRRFTFPKGTLLAPRSFKAYFSADTHLSLSNTQGQVVLLDPSGKVVNSSQVYGSAKENQSWALIKGSWQWTAKPTPGAANVFLAPAQKTTAKKSAAKTGSASFTKTASTTGVANSGAPSSLAEAPQGPLHTGVLALVGVFALLYGAYEYRSDLANKLHQFRVYRAARREARQSSKGR